MVADLMPRISYLTCDARMPFHVLPTLEKSRANILRRQIFEQPQTALAGPIVKRERERPPPPEAILELRAGEDDLLARLARRASPLVALFVDYGPTQAMLGDTLQAVRRHAWVDPLNRPGDADLTAHVQFARLASKALWA